MTTGGDVVSVRRAASHHGRLEVRCCCQPEKLLGSLPVPDGVREGQTLVYAYLDCQQNGHGKITFKVARWVLDATSTYPVSTGSSLIENTALR
jgi:hypothetical protein